MYTWWWQYALSFAGGERHDGIAEFMYLYYWESRVVPRGKKWSSIMAPTF